VPSDRSLAATFSSGWWRRGRPTAETTRSGDRGLAERQSLPHPYDGAVQTRRGHGEREGWLTVSGCDDGPGGCPCSVREQPPTPTESNQERAGNIEELSDVTDASWSLSEPQTGYESAAEPAAKGCPSAHTWCVPGVCPDPHHPSPSHRQIDGGRARHHGGLVVWDGVVHKSPGLLSRGSHVRFVPGASALTCRCPPCSRGQFTIPSRSEARAFTNCVSVRRTSEGRVAISRVLVSVSLFESPSSRWSR